VWTPMASTFSMKQTCDLLPPGVPDDFQLELLPPEDRLLDEDLAHGAHREPPVRDRPELLHVVDEAAARPPMV